MALTTARANRVIANVQRSEMSVRIGQDLYEGMEGKNQQRLIRPRHPSVRGS